MSKISFRKKYLILLSIFLLLIFPAFSFANINFSEIMFDPEGSDAGREWIEIKNTNQNSENIEKFKFCDSGSCHKFYDGYGNDFHMPGNSFGIIAKDPEKFKIDYPNFTGFILRSSFSINNSGELLELKDESGSVISIVEYNSESGGINGDTISLFDDIWKNGSSTPNAENIFKDLDIQELEDEENSLASSSSQEIERTYVELSNDMVGGKKKLKAEIIDNIPTLIAGAENEFNGRVYGITGVEIDNVEYIWTLGDGEKEYGKNIKHTFLFPGEYVLTLVVMSANFTGNVRKVVKVIEPNIEISEVDSDKNWIKLKNNYSEILKLDNWFLFVDGDKFKIPKETYILAKKEIIFPNQITNLDVKINSNIFLLFPNGEKVTKFIKKEDVVIKNISSDVSGENIVYVQKKINKNNIIKKIQSNTNVKSINDNSFLERNFVDQDKIIGTGNKNNIIKFNLDNNYGGEKLKLKKYNNFIMENIYFISFIFLVGFLTVTSFTLSYFQKRESGGDKIKEVAEEFEIEEME